MHWNNGLHAEDSERHAPHLREAAMRRFWQFGPIAAAMLGIACLGSVGCAHTSPNASDAGFPGVEELLDGRIGQEIVWQREGGAAPEVTAAVDALLATELGVEDAIQVALLENASLQATYERLGVAQADLVQAGLLQNPVLSASARFPDQPPRGVNFELVLVRDFLDLLMRPARKRLAETEFERIRIEVAAAVLDLVAEVEASYFYVVAAGQVADVRRLIAEASEASYEMAGRLRAAGNVSVLDLARERDLHETARLEWSRAEGEHLAAREMLTRRMGLWGARTNWRVPLRLPDLPSEEVTLEGLESAAVANRLDWAAALKEVDLRAEALGITRKWRGLAVAEIGLSSETDPDGSRVLGPEISVELPIFDRRKAKVARMMSELRQSEQRLIALEVDIRSEVRELRDRLVLLREQADHYREVVIPLREEIVRLTELNYNYMLAGVFELLQTKRAEYDGYEEYIDTVRDYWVTRAHLRRALGGGWPEPEPLPDTRASPENPHHEHDQKGSH